MITYEKEKGDKDRALHRYQLYQKRMEQKRKGKEKK